MNRMTFNKKTTFQPSPTRIRQIYMNDINLSRYKIVWVEFIPGKGYVTKHDQKLLGALDAIDKLKSFKMCYPSKEAAMNFLRNFRKRLDKNYRCLISTDKQFGMAKEENGYKIPYTEKQLKEVFILYGNPAVAIWVEIKNNGGFDNFNHWNQKQVAEWVKTNYHCSIKIAMEIAEVIM